RDFAIGHILDLLRDISAALFKFLVELRHQRFGALPVDLFESGARVVRHAIGDHRHRGQHRHQEDEKQFAAKAHWRTPCARQPHSSDPRCKYLFILYTEAYPETAASKSLCSMRCLPSNTVRLTYKICWPKSSTEVIIPRPAKIKYFGAFRVRAIRVNIFRDFSSINMVAASGAVGSILLSASQPNLKILEMAE